MKKPQDYFGRTRWTWTKQRVRKRAPPPRFRLGDHVHIQVPGKDGQHLLCRIALVTGKRYTLQCKRGTLSQRFGASELEPRDSSSLVSLDRWRQSNKIRIKEIVDEDLVSCSCTMTPTRFHYISDDENGNKEPHKRHPPAVSTLLYTLSYDDMATVERPNG